MDSTFTIKLGPKTWLPILMVVILGNLFGQSGTNLTDNLIPRGIEIRTLALTGNPFFPPLRSSNKTLFTADNRRLYLVSNQGFGFIPFPRRIQGSLTQLDPFFADLSFVQLSNNTYHLTNSQGVISRNLLQEQLNPLIRLPTSNQFLLAPGGIMVHSDGRISFLDYHGISWIDLRIPNRYIASVVRIVSPSQLLVSIQSKPTSFSSQEEDGSIEYGIVQLYTSNQRLLTGDRVELTGSLSRLGSLTATFFPIPSEYAPQLLGVVYDSSTSSPWLVYPNLGQGQVRLENPMTGEVRDVSLPGVIGSIQECVLQDQLLLCRTSAWQLITVHFLSSHFLSRPSAELTNFLTSYVQALRGIQNPFQEAILQTPSDFQRYLDRLSNQDALTLDHLNGLYRIFSYPLRTGQFLNPSVRLSVLDRLSDQTIPSPGLLVFARLIRFEYDVQVGIELIRLLENQFWPMVYEFRSEIQQFLTRRASQLQYDHLEYLVAWYRRMQQVLLPSTLEQLFPETLWTSLLDNQPNQRNRNLLLNR